MFTAAMRLTMALIVCCPPFPPRFQGEQTPPKSRKAAAIMALGFNVVMTTGTQATTGARTKEKNQSDRKPLIILNS